MADALTTDVEADTKKALAAFVVNNDDLVKLEALLSRFNIFRVLRAARNEIRHSNMLAWLLDPAESHGLGDLFLRRWLMQVLHDAAESAESFDKLPSPIEVDVLDIEYVDVAREKANIDLLLVVTTDADNQWVICVENKVESRQGRKQLEKYRTYVEHTFPQARRLFVFLTKYGELPEDQNWIPSTYSAVESVLRGCLDGRDRSIGREPLLLLTQYRNLLAEDFVDESESAKLAQEIYRKHKKAIDFILEYRLDPISDASSDMQDILRDNAGTLGIVMGVQNKGWVRFLPKEWDVPENAGGTAWGANSRFVACEVNFWNKRVELHVTIARAPDAWADLMWDRTAAPPFKRERKARAAYFVKLEKVRSEIPVAELAEMEPEDRKTRLQGWLTKELSQPRFREIVEAVRIELPKLKVS